MKVIHCSECNGKGVIEYDNGEGAPIIEECPECDGTGHIIILGD